MTQRVQDKRFHIWLRVCDNRDRYAQDFVLINPIPRRY
jgi:hypothetical protein